jgi:hypothetical protein
MEIKVALRMWAYHTESCSALQDVSGAHPEVEIKRICNLQKQTKSNRYTVSFFLCLHTIIPTMKKETPYMTAWLQGLLDCE